MFIQLPTVLNLKNTGPCRPEGNMDTLDTTSSTSTAIDTLKWCGEKHILPDGIGDAWPDGSAHNPKRPYLTAGLFLPGLTCRQTLCLLQKRNAANISGFDVFDMECITLPFHGEKPLTGILDTPMPVVLAFSAEGRNKYVPIPE